MNDTISCAINCNYLFQEKKSFKIRKKKLNDNNLNHTRENEKKSKEKINLIYLKESHSDFNYIIHQHLWQHPF